MRHIQYKRNASTLAPVMAGRADIFVDAYNSSSLQLTAGRCGASGVTFASRLGATLDVSAFPQRATSGCSHSPRTGRRAQAGAPPKRVERTSHALHHARSMEEARERSGKAGGNAVGFTSEQLNQLLVKKVGQEEMLLANRDFEKQR